MIAHISHYSAHFPNYYVVQHPNLGNDAAHSRLDHPTSLNIMQTIFHRHTHRLTWATQSFLDYVKLAIKITTTNEILGFVLNKKKKKGSRAAARIQPSTSLFAFWLRGAWDQMPHAPALMGRTLQLWAKTDPFFISCFYQLFWTSQL